MKKFLLFCLAFAFFSLYTMQESNITMQDLAITVRYIPSKEIIQASCEGPYNIYVEKNLEENTFSIRASKLFLPGYGKPFYASTKPNDNDVAILKKIITEFEEKRCTKKTEKI
jgi:hypothetical protein